MVRPPLWQLPPGVSPGTWDYAHAPNIAQNYEQFLAATPLTRLDLELVQRELPPPGPDRATVVADLGCGSGRSAIPLSLQGYRVLGLDLSQPMLERMQAAAQSAKASVWAVRANLVQLEAIEDRAVDHAVCLFSTLGMIRRRQHRRQFLRHAWRILRPGGLLIVHAHNRRAWLRHPGGLRRTLHSLWQSARSDHEFGDSIYAYRGLADMYLHSFSRRELSSDLRHAGFQINQILRVSLTGDRLLPRTAPEIAGGFFAICRNVVDG